MSFKRSGDRRETVTSPNVTQKRLRDGNVIGYTYDNLGREVARNVPNITAYEYDYTFVYDHLGRLTQASQPSGGNAVTFAYNAFGNLLSENSTMGGVALYLRNYGYDVAGRRTKLTHGDGLYIDYVYDNANAVTEIRENGATSGVGVLARYVYNDLGNRTKLTLGNGAITNYGYDAAARLSSLAHDLPGTASDVTSTFTYNNAHQIANRAVSNDIYRWADGAAVDRIFNTNNLNQYTQVGTTNPTYDLRGNLKQSGTVAYTYTSENLMASAGSVTMRYDPVGRLLRNESEAMFAYDGTQILAELNNSNRAILRRYVHGPGTDAPIVWYEGAGTADRRFMQADERGSIVNVSNSAGTVIGTNTYDEFGIPGASNIGRFGYVCGRFFDHPRHAN